MNMNIIVAERNAIEYFCLLNPVQAKKVLFSMSLLKGDMRLGDSTVPEAARIAKFYDGVIQAGFAKELTAKLVEGYSKKHPGELLTKKAAEAYTDARYRKAYETFGLYGFDYIITALSRGKAYVRNPENGIDEKHMLMALRWNERRENVDVEASNKRHYRKGLQLVGLGDMSDVLEKYSFCIANLYELVPEGKENRIACSMDVPSDPDKNDRQTQEEPAVKSMPEMMIHIIHCADLVKEFYSLVKPEPPTGFAEEDLYEGSHIYALAEQELLKNPEVVIEYVRQKGAYNSCITRLTEEFDENELDAIYNHKDVVTVLITGW